MTVQDIMTKVISIAGVAVNSTMAIDWINEAKDRLSMTYDSACIRMKLDTDETQEYSLPDSSMGVIMIERDGATYRSYSVDGNIVELEHPGQYTVFYLSKPEDVTDDTDELTLPEGYHGPVAFFVASKATNPPSQALEQEFMSLSAQVDARLSRQKRRGMRIPKRMWR